MTLRGFFVLRGALALNGFTSPAEWGALQSGGPRQQKGHALVCSFLFEEQNLGGAAVLGMGATLILAQCVEELGDCVMLQL